MKPKLKFDKKAILDFFVDNGEKILFAGVVVCFLLFVYKAVGRERFDKAPKDLTDAATSARSHIDGCDDNVDKKIVDYPKRIEEISHPIEVEPYEWVTALNTPIIKPPGKRGEPVLYAVEELRGTPGVGCFSGRGNPQRGAGAGAYGKAEQEDRGKRWVVLTGLVNYDKYIKSFRECYKDAAKKLPQKDVPVFIHYEVHRAEITGESQDPAKLEWKRPFHSLKTEMQRYGGTSAMSADLVAANFRDEVLTFPLPTREDRDWDSEVVHPPEIPKQKLDQQQGGGHPGGKTGKENAPDEGKTDGPDELIGFPRAGGMGGGTRGGMGGGMMGGAMPGGAMPGGAMPGGMGGGMAMRMGGRDRAMMGQKKLSPYVLFRFFDFNAEPGKRYRYRVQLYVANPNYGLPANLLNKEIRERMKGESTNKEVYLKSGWSEPSDVVAVPRDDRLLAVSVKPSSRTATPPTGKIMAIHWDMNEGVEIADEFDIQLGKLVNLLNQKVPEGKDKFDSPGRIPMMGGGKGPDGMGPGMGPGMDRGDDGRRGPRAGGNRERSPRRSKKSRRKRSTTRPRCWSWTSAAVADCPAKTGTSSGPAKYSSSPPTASCESITTWTTWTPTRPKSPRRNDLAACKALAAASKVLAAAWGMPGGGMPGDF